MWHGQPMRVSRVTVCRLRNDILGSGKMRKGQRIIQNRNKQTTPFIQASWTGIFFTQRVRDGNNIVNKVFLHVDETPRWILTFVWELSHQFSERDESSCSNMKWNTTRSISYFHCDPARVLLLTFPHSILFFPSFPSLSFYVSSDPRNLNFQFQKTSFC